MYQQHLPPALCMCIPEGFLSIVEPKVSLEVVFESKTESTRLAHKGFFPRVDYPVLQQAHLTLKGLVALATFEWPLLRVRSLVDSQVARCREALVAGLARVRPGTRVDRLVLSEVLLPGKTFPTNVAHEGLDFGMRHLMVTERTGGGECAVTGVAL